MQTRSTARLRPPTQLLRPVKPIKPGTTVQTLRWPSDDAGQAPCHRPTGCCKPGRPVAVATKRWPSDDAGQAPAVKPDKPVAVATKRWPSDDAAQAPAPRPGTVQTLRWPSDDSTQCPPIRRC